MAIRRWVRPPVWLHVVGSAVALPFGFLGGGALSALAVASGDSLLKGTSGAPFAVGTVLLVLCFFAFPFLGLFGFIYLVHRLPARCPRCGGPARAQSFHSKQAVADAYQCGDCGHRHAWDDLSPWPRLAAAARAIKWLGAGVAGLVFAGMLAALAFFLGSTFLHYLPFLLTAMAALWLLVGPLVLRHHRRARRPVPWALVLLPLVVAAALAPARAALVIPGERGFLWDGIKDDSGKPLILIAPVEPFSLRWAADLASGLAGAGLALLVGWAVARRQAHRVRRVAIKQLRARRFEVEGEVVAETAPLCSTRWTVRLRGPQRGIERSVEAHELQLDDGSGRVAVDPRGAELAPPLNALWPRARLLLRRRARWSLLPRDLGVQVETSLQPGDRLRLIAHFEAASADAGGLVARAGRAPPGLAARLFDRASPAPPFLLGDGSRLGLRLALRAPLLRAAALVALWLLPSGYMAAQLASLLTYRHWQESQLLAYGPREHRNRLLLERLEGSSGPARAQLVAALQRISLSPDERAWAPRLRRWAADPDPGLRAFAVRGLAAVGERDAASLSAFERALADPEASPRAQAAAALTALGEDGRAVAERVLRGAGPPPGRLAAAGVLAKLLPDRKALRRQMLPLLSEPEPALRREAARLLAGGDPEEIAALREALEDPVLEVREAALLALASTDRAHLGALPLEALVPFLGSASWGVQDEAWRGVQARPAGVVQSVLVAELSSGQQARVVQALRWLEALPQPPTAEAAPVLGRLMEEGPDSLRNSVRRQLERMGRDAAGAVPSLARALRADHSQRSASLRLLGELGPAGAGAIPALEALLSREPTNSEAAAALLRVRTPAREAGWEERLDEEPILALEAGAFRFAERLPAPKVGEAPLALAKGRAGPAVVIDGSRPIELSWPEPVALGGDFTLETWLRLPDASSSFYVVDTNLFFFRVEWGHPLLGWRDGATEREVQTRRLLNHALAAGWHHLAVVHDGEARALHCYFDGALAFTLADFLLGYDYAAGPSPSQPQLVTSELASRLRYLRLGGGWQLVPKPREAARLDSVRLYDHLRTAAQVAQSAGLAAERAE